MGVLLMAVASGALMYFFWLIFRHLLHWKALSSSLPAPRSYPFIGHATITKPDPEGFVNQLMGMASLYPERGMCLFWIGPRPALMLYSAKTIQPVVTSSRHLNKGFAYDLLHPWLGLSVLTSESAEWRPRRKLLTPAFHYDILKDFVPVFNEHSLILVEKLETLPEGAWVDISSLLSLCTLDIICQTSMGRNVNAQQHTDSAYVRAIHLINNLIQERIKKPHMWSDFIYNNFGDGKLHNECLQTLHSFTRQVIDEREAQLEKKQWKQDGERQAFLDMLLHLMHHGQIRKEDIQPEVDTFMFEGHDTTSTALTWSLHLIGNDDRVQAKLQKEIDEVVGEARQLSPEHISRLKYLECAIKETLRLFPSVPIVMRELGEDELIDGTLVPSGTPILLNQYLVHRDPEQWNDPEVFNPDRFLSEKSSGRHSFAFVPFSAGSRNCIGQRFAIMEEKVILAHLLKQFTVRSVEKRCDVRPKMDLIIRPIGSIHITLQKRAVVS